MIAQGPHSLGVFILRTISDLIQSANGSTAMILSDGTTRQEKNPIY